jgi:hypothetical protein
MAYKSIGFTVLGLFHTTSIVDNLDWTRRFYRTAFGTTPTALLFDNGRYASMSFIAGADHCLNSKVSDLSRVRQNISALGIGFEVDLPGHIVLNPDKCQGLRHGFVAELASNDPRSRSV